MILKKPIPFEEAIRSRDVKELLPTSLSSRDLSQLNAELRQRAMFSARVTHAGFLQRAGRLIDRIVSQEGGSGKMMDPARARLALKDFLAEISYRPREGEEGTIQDLSTDARLNLILETNLQQAYGYGQWQAGNNETTLDNFPAQELLRVTPVAEPRDWPERWQEAGGQFFDGGRMIALKDDPIWTEISAFGTPWPPFDFNSGMGVRDVSREEAVSFGLISADEQISLPDRSFNEDAQASAEQFDRELLGALADHPRLTVKDGVLRFKNRQSKIENHK